MDKSLNTELIRSIASRDQLMAFLRDNVNTIELLANAHPETLIRSIATFALCELQMGADMKFEIREDKDDD